MRDETPDYFDVMKQTTRDIHDHCGMDVNILWDDGKMRVVRSHKLRLWNGLGHVEYLVEHRDLVERGVAYQRFLEDLTSAARKRLDVSG